MSNAHNGLPMSAPSNRQGAQGQPLPSLDGIRAVSVLIVLVSHTGFGQVIPGGFGVTVFFFLSGFLITHLLIREQATIGRISIAQFYLRRAFRLFPPLVATLLLAYGLHSLGLVGGTFTVAGLASQVLYVANYFYIFMDGLTAIPSGTIVLWSLAVEEQFYIVYPIVFAALFGFGASARQVAAIFVVTCAIVLGWRVFLVESGWAVDSLRTFYATDTRIDSLLFGCILALVTGDWIATTEGKAMSARLWLALAVAMMVLLVCFAIRGEVFRETVRYTLQGLALMPIFVAALKHPGHPLFRPLNTWPMETLGRLSYSLYLVHFIVASALMRNLPNLAANRWALTAGTLVLSIAIALILDKTIEPYFRRLRARHRPSMVPVTERDEAAASLKAV